MRMNDVFKKTLSVLLVLCMVFSWVLPANAYDAGVRFNQVSNDRVSANLIGKDAVQLEGNQPQYKPTDVVRVSIFLDKLGVLEAGFPVNDLAGNADAMAYRDKLQKEQSALINKIEKAIDAELDVVWNLTLATNLISANVQFCKIEAIRSVRGVKNVVVETCYQPDVASKAEANPNMATSGMQTGAYGSYAAGYTGAGSKVAIIDTGLDVDHRSFDAAAYLYSLNKLAEMEDVPASDFIAGLNLMDADAIAEVLAELNVFERVDVTAEDLYFNEKIPFAFNYVDGNLDVTHLHDNMGEHGSHVAGIATANTYVPNADGTFSNALEEVFVQGVAPDAQVMVMKVFGAKGGAYPADYMAAIEDAVLLGADSINLSLGGGNPGMSKDSEDAYNAIFESLEKSGVVVTISAGNSGSWVDASENGIPYLYLDDVGIHTGGAPGSYTNSLGVASVNNAGFVSNYVTVNDSRLAYFEMLDDGNGNYYGNAPFVTLAGAQEYVFLNGIGTPEQFASLGEGALEGKIAICYRGETSFSEKANAAAEAGAIGVIIVNNTTGPIYLNLTGYEHNVPVVSMTFANGELLKGNALTDEEGNTLGWTGTMTVSGASEQDAFLYDDAYAMSSFSSWGVPGSLTMKPEITAPGGSILSVGGAYKGGISDHETYEVMSGTSMAAPQVAGMAALLAQYIRENNLEEQTGLDARTLAQSLLMSTAEPFGDAANGGYYYPVLQQGAGIANIGAAIAADSYILMNEDATESFADGKVKVELGDDPNRTGVYSFSFTLNNLTDEEELFILRADFFTQGLTSDGVNLYMNTTTMGLSADVTYLVDGVEADYVNLEANGSATVEVTVALGADDKEALDYYFETGAYLEGYVYAIGYTGQEGVAGTVHSIPVLGFYGNWSDPSMYDKLSYENFVLEGSENRAPYLYESNFGSNKVNGLFISYTGDPSEYYFGGNPLIPDAVYMPERNAISGVTGDAISTIGFASIRNAGAGFFQVYDHTNDMYLVNQDLGPVSSAYYYVNGGVWKNTYWELDTNLVPAGIEDGTVLEVGMNLVPEYYVNEDGSVDWDALGSGTMFSMTMTVDNTAPVVKDVTIDKDGLVLHLDVMENQYVAAVALLDASGEYAFAMAGSQADAVAGQACQYDLDLTDVNGASFLLQVYDYAMNCTTYEINTQIGEVVDTVDAVELSESSIMVQKGNTEKLTATVLPINTIDRTVTWSSSDESVVIVAEDGTILGVEVGTAYVTATSVADPTVSASCLVEVIDVSTNLRGFVWDKEGSIWYSQFNTATIPEYEILMGDFLDIDYIAAACVGPDGTIYASSLNTSSYSGELYAMNPLTWEITHLSDCGGYFYSDMTYAENLYGPGQDALLVTYGPYLIAVDPTTGEWLEIIDEYEDILVGITTCYSYTDEYGDTFVAVYLAAADGTLYQDMYFYYPDYEATFSYNMAFYGERTFIETGIDVGEAIYFNSLTYDIDGGMIYWSAFEQDVDDNVTLYAIDEFNNFKVYNLGQFADGVWPVAGLMFLDCLNGGEHTFSDEYYYEYYIEDGQLCVITAHYCAMCGEEVIETALVGDVNGDGEISVLDAMALSQYIAGYTDEVNELVADVDGNGEIDVRDAMRIAQYITGEIEYFPVLDLLS